MFTITLITIFLLGLSIGSFLNVLINRLHDKEKITGRSKCPKCGHVLSIKDLFPIFSFLFLKGKCRYCKEKISPQYILVELATGILFVVMFLFHFSNLDNVNYINILSFIKNIILSILCVVIFVYDVKYMEIPDEIVIPGALIILIINVIITKNIIVFIVGGVVGILFFLIQYLGSKGTWVGGGDSRIGFLIGVSFGNIYYVFFVIFIGYLLGSIYSVPLLIRKYIQKEKNINSVIPLGPFLSLSMIISLFLLRFLK